VVTLSVDQVLFRQAIQVFTVFMWIIEAIPYGGAA